MISEELEKTLQRTQKYAKSLQHQYMTLEHLLLSMLDDIDVLKVMEACVIDVNTLKKNLDNFVESNLKELISNSSENEIKPTLGFQRVIQRAVIHVQSSGKEEANGANVLVAIFSERESHAVYFLQQQNLNRLDHFKKMKIALGTAQFGLDYGVSNNSGKVSYNETKLILKKAKKFKICTLDTAMSYGNCEKILGDIGVSNFNLITKLPPIPNNLLNIESWITDNLNRSLDKIILSL